MSRGIWIGAAAYAIWGLFPIYWKQLQAVPATQVIAHRIAWSFAVLLPVLAVTKWRAARAAGAFDAGTVGAGSFGGYADSRTVAVYAIAAVLIAVNWFVYVWAVTHGLVVETSLGYFITPLVNVLLGVVVLRERLRAGQWLAVGIAASGVLYLTVIYGSVPWIALALATSFGTYGLVKKQAPMSPLPGLTLETGLLVIPAVLFLVMADVQGTGAFGHAGPTMTLLMAGAGVVTTVPLLLFATAVRLIPLSAIGILQFIAPTIQFLLAVFVYREPFSSQQLAGFGLVWVALAVFSLDGALHQQHSRDHHPTGTRR